MPYTHRPLDRSPLNIDPYANDPGHWGASLVNVAEIMLACLDAAGAKSVTEVGAYAGDLTGLLVRWAEGSGARVTAVDPAPRRPLERLEEESGLELVRQTSHDALRQVPMPDAVVLDGDHNYYTVSGELRLIGERAQGKDLPLILMHDVCWPHARRDTYFDPDQVPDEYRQPIVEGAGLFPGEPGVRTGGLPYKWAAGREGGDRNGVLTAVEEFVASRDGLRLVVVPAFFGLGVIWHGDVGYAKNVKQVLAPWDDDPVVERLEANRVLHLASSHFHLTEANALREQKARQEAVLRRLLESSAFSVAERLSRLRQRLGIATEQSVVSKADVRGVLPD